MALPDVRIQKMIDRFLTVLQESVSVKAVYLFGSFARGNAGEFSDIDLAVISPVFEKMKPFERLVFLGRVAWEAGTPRIEAIGFTPREFASSSRLAFPSEIKEKGIAMNIPRAA